MNVSKPPAMDVTRTTTPTATTTTTTTTKTTTTATTTTTTAVFTNLLSHSRVNTSSQP